MNVVSGALRALWALVLSEPVAFLTHKAVTPIESPVLPSGTAVTVTTPAGQPDVVTTV